MGFESRNRRNDLISLTTVFMIRSLREIKNSISLTADISSIEILQSAKSSYIHFLL